MIEGLLRETLQTAYPELIWSENNYEAQDNTGTVYKEAGLPPDIHETGLRFPYYMVWVRSSDFDLAQRVSEGSVTLLNKMNRIEYTNHEGATYEVIFIEATSDANRIGRTENVMEWSSNFKATIRRKNI
jgi:hypothetical protein